MEHWSDLDLADADPPETKHFKNEVEKHEEISLVDILEVISSPRVVNVITEELCNKYN